MSEIEKTVREWAEKQKVWDTLSDDADIAKNRLDALYQARDKAANEAREARAKALGELYPGTRFPVFVGGYVVSNHRGPGMRVDKATVIGEAKPKAEGAEMVEMEIGDTKDGELFALKHNVLVKVFQSGDIVRTSGAPFTREVRVYVARPKP